MGRLIGLWQWWPCYLYIDVPEVVGIFTLICFVRSVSTKLNKGCLLRVVLITFVLWYSLNFKPDVLICF